MGAQKVFSRGFLRGFLEEGFQKVLSSCRLEIGETLLGLLGSFKA